MFRLFRRSPESEAEPRLFSVGEGRRVYAIGDIHGRRDLLRQLIETIVADQAGRTRVEEFHLILLGDLIDRGPESAGVIGLALALATEWPGFVCLKGNHEELFEDAFRGETQALRFFRGMGRDTLLSYGIDGDLIVQADDVDLHAAILAHVPELHRDFIAALPSYCAIGDYLFVHAGIRPGVALEEQYAQDLHWIRGDFLRSRDEHPHMVVHGHSITQDVDERSNRIGIDTGAYASGRLTAIGLEGTERWYLST